MQRFYRSMAITALVLAGGPGSALAEDAAITHGKALVEANCSRCHAVGREDHSKHPEAPAFRTLWQRYPIDALEEAFAEGIYVGHPDMPEFIADPDQIEAIIAYIDALHE